MSTLARRSASIAAGLSGPVVVGVATVLLLTAPIIRGGNRFIALSVLECLALVLLCAMALTVARRPESIRVAVWGGYSGDRTPPADSLLTKGGAVRWVPQIDCSRLLLAFAPLWLAVIQLMPWPAAVWRRLPGHDRYAQALDVLQLGDVGWRPLSLMPDATVLSLLAGIPLTALFLLGLLASHGAVRTLVRVVVLVSAAQAVFGLLQVGGGRELYFGAQAYGRAIGSFANPNHLASALAMALPLAIFLLREALAKPGRTEGQRRRLGIGADLMRTLSVTFWAVVLLFLLSALVASASRAGILVALVVAGLSLLLIPVAKGARRQRWWRAGLAAAVLVVVLMAVGTEGLLSRFDGGVQQDARWQIFVASARAAWTYFPWGSGMGTFAGVFAPFQSPTLTHFVDFAHNDYLQLAVEGGLPFLLQAGLALALAVGSVRRLLRRLRDDPASPWTVLQASCALGLLAVLLHSLVDFNLRIPANAMVAAFFAGVILRRSSRADAGGVRTQPSSAMQPAAAG